MKFILPEKRFTKTCLLFVFAALLFSTSLQAQTKKKSASKTVAKKTAKPAKDARKDKKKEQLAKKSVKKDTKKEKQANARTSRRDTRSSRQQASRDSKKDSKNAKQTAKDNSRDKNSKKKDKKTIEAERRAEAARRKAEEARRQAALEAQRRREQAAREARERKLAFERGLRTQTAENILKDNIEGEDLDVRHAAVSALGSRAGTVVVMEAKTGKVVTMVNQDWAIKNSFKPCSTIKLVTGVGGLNEHIINEEGGIGSSTSGLGLDAATARSNNGYFQRVGSNFGNAKMIAYAKTLGLGEKTGINADGETPGKLPYGNNNARIYSHGDDFEVTPLQLAVMVSAISNDGKKVVPQIVKQRNERTSFRPKFREQVSVPYQTVQGVLPGMIGAAEYGTARRGVDPSQGIAGKTGSCIFKGSWIGLFASVAPVEDPQYSVVVITRGEGERGKYAAAVAGHVYRALAPRLRRNQEKYLALKNVRPAPTDKNLAVADEEEEDDAAEGEAAESVQPIIVGSSNANAAVNRTVTPKKMVQKTTLSKPTFPPVVIQYDKEKAAKSRPRIVKN
jgi:penicillin-binding protein 2